MTMWSVNSVAHDTPHKQRIITYFSIFQLIVSFLLLTTLLFFNYSQQSCFQMQSAVCRKKALINPPKGRQAELAYSWWTYFAAKEPDTSLRRWWGSDHSLLETHLQMKNNLALRLMIYRQLFAYTFTTTTYRLTWNVCTTLTQKWCLRNFGKN